MVESVRFLGVKPQVELEGSLFAPANVSWGSEVDTRGSVFARRGSEEVVIYLGDARR